jgi:hypothetical protein
LDAFAAVITCKKAELLMDRKAFGGNVGGRGIEDLALEVEGVVVGLLSLSPSFEKEY